MLFAGHASYAQFLRQLGPSGIVAGIASVVCFLLAAFVLVSWRASSARRGRGQALARATFVKGFPRILRLAAPLFYVPVEASDDIARGGKRRPLAKLCDAFTKGDATRGCLLVLGDAGAGKTTFLLDYASRAENFANGRAKPLLLALSHPDVLAEIERVDSDARAATLLMLDGFDEHPGASVNAGAALGELLARCSGFRRVLVTARSELFPDAELIPDRIALGDPSEKDEEARDDTPHDDSTDIRVETVRILPPTEAELGKYLERRHPLALHRRWAAKPVLANSRMIRESRLLLAHVDELVGLERAGKPPTLSAALKTILRAWLRRERRAEDTEPMLKFTHALALATFKRQRDGKHGLVPLTEIEAEAGDAELAKPRLANDPGAVVFADGEDRFAFAQTSFFEYALAEALFALEAEKRRAFLGDRIVTFPLSLKRFALESFVMAGADLSSWDLTDSDLSGADLRDANLSQVRLSGANLTGARLCRADLRDSALDRANLSEADLSEANLTGAELLDSNLTGANLDNSKLDRADLNGAALRDASLRGATLRSTALDQEALKSVAPAGAELEEQTIKEPVAGIRFSWVPGGRFQMGSDKELSESPAHWVRVSSFWLGQTPVTNRQYSVFLEQTGHREPEGWNDERFSDPEQPAVGVSFDDAVAFCTWLSEASGLTITLPSEAQWEYAARGPDGREFPWGSDEPDASRARYAEDVMSGGPAKVGSYPPGRGPFGTLDQAGNVWEWCLDSWDGMAYLKRAGKELVDPDVMDGKPGLKPVRGGSWFSPPEDLRATLRGRNEATRRDEDQGFRVALG